MRSILGSVKLGSLSLWPAIVTLAASFGVSGLTGCVIVSSESHQSSVDTVSEPPADTSPSTDTPSTDEPVEATIDANQALDSDAGDGVGVFVEYTSGGHWHVWTSCDTNLSDAVCAFDAFVSVTNGDKITNATAETLENGDIIEKRADGSLHLAVRTSSELDGMVFDTPPGAVIEVKALFDGEVDPRVLYWLGDGVVHQGAPTDPIRLKPSAP